MGHWFDLELCEWNSIQFISDEFSVELVLYVSEFITYITIITY